MEFLGVLVDAIPASCEECPYHRLRKCQKIKKLLDIGGRCPLRVRVKKEIEVSGETGAEIIRVWMNRDDYW
jgi:hypothetical protein